MGKSIARLLLNAGYDVRAHDPHHGDEALAGVHTASSIEKCVSDSSVVFEAVSEDLGTKAKVLRAISEATEGVIASKTSTFMPSVLTEFVADSKRFLVGRLSTAETAQKKSGQSTDTKTQDLNRIQAQPKSDNRGIGL